MRFVRYSRADDGVVRSGIVLAGRIHKLPDDLHFADIRSAEDFDRIAAAGAEQPADIDYASARIHSPVETPPSVRDFMSFENHVVTSMSALGRQVDPVWYDQPVFYFSNPAAIVGASADIPVAPGSGEFDFELEVAAVIGVGGSDISVADAEKHILGYTILCDWSARDLQEREMRVGLGPAKGKDTASTLGPYLVTPDELEPLRTGKGFDVSLTVDVNGRRFSEGNWSTIYWSFAQMIAYASRGTQLRPGDVIGSGTVGTGCILELGRVHGFDVYPYLVPGDVVTINAGPLGTIQTTIIPGAAPVPL